MAVAIVTGSAGLIGSETARHFAGLGMHVVGIDNDLRGYFFGPASSTRDHAARLAADLGDAYTHAEVDVRDRDGLARLFARYGTAVELVVHAAAQPSHDWAAREPFTDFDVNAVGTLNVLETVRQHCPEAVVVHCSTNKVYGDLPNDLPFVEHATRFELEPGHRYADGIDESLSIDRSLHSLFGASKVAADVLVQEYGRYFGLRTVCFRGGTLTGPAHSAAELHGFLAYLMRCVMERRTYTVFGYGGKMVRDAIHAHDVVTAFEAFFRAPRVAEVYNLGGGPTSNTSHLEAFALAAEISGVEAVVEHTDTPRTGDHRWYVSDLTRFRSHYPDWDLTYDVPAILREIHDANVGRWTPSAPAP